MHFKTTRPAQQQRILSQIQIAKLGDGIDESPTVIAEDNKTGRK